MISYITAQGGNYYQGHKSSLVAQLSPAVGSLQYQFTVQETQLVVQRKLKLECIIGKQ